MVLLVINTLSSHSDLAVSAFAHRLSAFAGNFELRTTELLPDIFNRLLIIVIVLVKFNN